jgi:hypothetical protein
MWVALSHEPDRPVNLQGGKGLDLGHNPPGGRVPNFVAALPPYEPKMVRKMGSERWGRIRVEIFMTPFF